jgi:hypothetical protein
LTVPAAADVVGFVPYDPGSDPVPEPVGRDDSSLAGETVEERLPRDMLTTDDVPTKADPDEVPTAGPVPVEGARMGRSLLALFLLALVGAAAGGISVMKCERDQPSARSDSRVTLP